MSDDRCSVVLASDGRYLLFLAADRSGNDVSTTSAAAAARKLIPALPPTPELAMYFADKTDGAQSCLTVAAPDHKLPWTRVFQSLGVFPREEVIAGLLGYIRMMQ